MRPKVIVIGAGVVGAAVAREFSRYQVDLLILEKEKEVAFGTSKANSGIVHSGVHYPSTDPKARLCVLGNQLYPQMCEELEVPYQPNGSLIVAQTQSDLETLQVFFEQGQANGVPGLEILDPQQILEVEPRLSPKLLGALSCPSGGIVSPFELTQALVENAVANGGVLQTEAEVKALIPRGEQVLVKWEGVQGEQEAWADYVVIAAGLGGRELAQSLGEDLPLKARKGQEWILDTQVGNWVRQTIYPVPSPNSKGILLIPTAHGNLMVGPTATLTEVDDVETTRDGDQQIFAEAKILLPDLPQWAIIASFSGLRAVYGSDKFYFKPSAQSPRVMHLAGIQSPGLTAAPAIALDVVESASQLIPLSSNPDFNPRRPGIRTIRSFSWAQREEKIKEDPTWGEIVCRCEMVSKHEILQAIAHGARTLDGIKLRTRAGMGRCQGGFCTPKILRILREELGEEPSKRGGGSWMLLGETKSLRKGGEQ